MSKLPVIKNINELIPKPVGGWLSGELIAAQHIHIDSNSIITAAGIFNKFSYAIDGITDGEVPFPDGFILVKISTDKAERLDWVVVHRLIKFGSIDGGNGKIMGAGQMEKTETVFNTGFSILQTLGNGFIIDKKRRGEFNSKSGVVTAIVQYELYVNRILISGMSLAFDINLIQQGHVKHGNHPEAAKAVQARKGHKAKS